MPLSHSPTSTRTRVALGLAAALVVVLGAIGARGLLEARAEVQVLEAMRDSLDDLRLAFDSCRYELGREEMAFQAFDRSVDSLREEIRRYEARDERGVAAAVYDAYLETFDLYNRSVGEWETKADALRASSEVCRELARRHNAAAETLRVELDRRREGG